ncbi:MAG: DUF2318 domain-containing protein [Chloroflexi bacterium]|nr:DUF2318 domain-containing protein [Chloroflexota bacterium]
MSRKQASVLLVSLLGLILLLAACSSSQSSAAQPAGRRAAAGGIRPTWIAAETGGDTVALPVGEVQKAIMTHFKVKMTTTEETFMAYQFEGRIHARADICPPCRSESFSLDGDRLVCDTCGTIFEARTGAGVSGACVAYPKASVPYEIRDGRLFMKRSDLLTAYQTTLKPRKS